MVTVLLLLMAMKIEKINKSQIKKRIKETKIGNSADEVPYLRSVAYSVELVLLFKHRFSGGGPCLHNKRVVFLPVFFYR